MYPTFTKWEQPGGQGMKNPRVAAQDAGVGDV